ncbi:hypothetical protein C0995_002283 [Termitomyces sp. Mi166|nr:hypothetical protein C0995_002283 [Termitomyces sp. Mi166\
MLTKIRNPTSAAVTRSALSPDPTAQSAPYEKFPSLAANPWSVPLIIAAQPQPPPQNVVSFPLLLLPSQPPSQNMLTGKHKADDSGEEPESKWMKDRE